MYIDKTLKGGIKMDTIEKVNKIICIDHLTKDFGYQRGVFDISFNVYQGEVFGFLGPNGAGKTTTIRHIMGFAKPQSGTVSVFGKESYQYYNQILENIGYLPGEVALPENLTGKQFIQMMQELRKAKNFKRLQYLLEKFPLDLDEDVKRMSLGDKRKLAIITAFMNDPDVLILDEPTSGLDPIMQEKFIQFIFEEKQRGKTILLSSHIFKEVDATCDRIAIIKDGKIVSIFVANDLKYNTNKTYQITFSNDTSFTQFCQMNFQISFTDPTKKIVKVNIDNIQINTLIQALKSLDVSSFSEIQFSLEDYFMNFYKQDQTYGGI